MNRTLIRHGFLLTFVSLFGAFFIPLMSIPRLGLSAHTIGMMSGTLLIAVGAVWSQFDLGERPRRVLHWSWLYAGYVNWFAILLGAILGTGRTTPLASGGIVGSSAAELVVTVLLVSVGLISLFAAGLSLWGFRRPGSTSGAS